MEVERHRVVVGYNWKRKRAKREIRDVVAKTLEAVASIHGTIERGRRRCATANMERVLIALSRIDGERINSIPPPLCVFDNRADSNPTSLNSNIYTVSLSRMI
jgi:hypothetical protein